MSDSYKPKIIFITDCYLRFLLVLDWLLRDGFSLLVSSS